MRPINRPALPRCRARGLVRLSNRGSPVSLAVETLISLLDLEQLEVNLFRGVSPQDGWQRVFGGQVIGQALVAACRTVDGRLPHSLHAYFMLPGDPRVPIIYEVERLRDGGSFSTRRVKAIQHGHAIFALSASFQVAEEGLTHAAAMPNVPAPEDLPGEAVFRDAFLKRVPEPVRRYFERERPIELRPVEFQRYLSLEPLDPVFHVWIRTTGPLPDDPALHQCVLAYASDLTLLDSTLIPHGLSVFAPEMQTASLDHSLWFHEPFRADDWLLYAQESPFVGHSRGFARGSIFTRDGRLIASVAQEGLIRRRTAAKPHKK